jgi:hypothetical protein
LAAIAVPQAKRGTLIGSLIRPTVCVRGPPRYPNAAGLAAESPRETIPRLSFCKEVGIADRHSAAVPRLGFVERLYPTRTHHDCCTAEQISPQRITLKRCVHALEIAMTLNPWMFGLEAVQQGWQAQIALTLKLMRSFAGGTRNEISSSSKSSGVVDDANAQKNVVAFTPAPANIERPEAPTAIDDARRRKAIKTLPASKKTHKKASRMKAVKNSARKSARRSTRRPR